MNNVIYIRKCQNAPIALRELADRIESGAAGSQNVTVINTPDVYHFGAGSDEQAALEALFNLNYAIHKMMNATME